MSKKQRKRLEKIVDVKKKKVNSLKRKHKSDRSLNSLTVI